MRMPVARDRFAAPAVLLALALCAPASAANPVTPVTPASPAIAESGRGTPVDRIVAVVDEDPILESDLARALALELEVRKAGESDAALRRRILEDLVVDRLRLHEMTKYGAPEPPIEEVDRQLQQVRARFASDAAYRAALSNAGLDEERLRQLLARQVAVLSFIEERLGPRVLVESDEIRRYYDESLIPELKAKGSALPPLEAVRDRIREVLRERKLNDEIAKWTEDLRRQADVVDLLERPDAPLPPVVLTLRPPASKPRPAPDKPPSI